MPVADATLTPILRVVASRRTAPRGRTRLAKIAMALLPRNISLFARNLWDVGNGGGLMNIFAEGAENGEEL